MPSGLRKTTGNHFEIYYEQPWGGVASDKDPVDINDNQLQVQQGVVAIDGALCYTNMIADPTRFLFVQGSANAYLAIIFEYTGLLFGLDQFGGLYTYDNVAGKFNQSIVASDGPWVTASPPTAVQIVNGTAYIANFGRNSIYQYDGTAYTLESNYTGGLVFGVLDDYLLQLNTNSATDGVQSNRINWSGPGEFTTWDPSVNRTAGFNTLAAVEDQLTGFFSYASVGVAVSRKALIELSPTGVAIGPFTFTTLWTSTVGQGGVYPGSCTQYGQRGLLVTDSGVYSVSTGAGFTDISGSARTAILSSFQLSELVNSIQIPSVGANLLLYYFNSSYPTPFYIVCGTVFQFGELNQTLQVWLMDLNTGIWSNLSYNVDTLVNSQNGTAFTNCLVSSLKVYTFDFPAPDQASSAQQFVNPLTLILINVTVNGTNQTVTLYPTVFKKNVTNDANNIAGNLNLAFKAQELKLGFTRKSTTRRLVVKAYGTGTLACSIVDIDGTVTSLGDIILDGSLNAKTYYSPLGIATVEAPQLSITSTNFKGVIVKAMLAGTYADGEID